jgi:YbbR domain-containing protein
MDKGNEKRLGIKIICVILAFGLWLYITNVDNPMRTSNLKGVNVQLINEDSLAKSNLAIAPGQTYTVDLKLEGVYNEIYAVEKEDFSINVDLSTYALKIGENNIPVQIENYPAGINIKNNEALSVKVIIEELVEKEVNVYSNVKTTFKSGFNQHSTTVQPSVIKISGPASAVNKVVSASLVGEASNLDGDYSGEFSIIPIDENGDEVQNIKISQSQGELYLKAGIQKEVDIGISYSGSLKDGLKIEMVDLSSNKITIVGEIEDIGKISKIETQPIDLSLITSTQDIQLNFIVPEGISIANSSKYIMANIKVKEEVITPKTIEGITTKTIDGIKVNLNGKKDGQFTYEVSNISVTVSGTADALSALTLADFTASASVAELIAPGDSEVTLNVSLVKSNDNVKISSKPEKVKITVK